MSPSASEAEPGTTCEWCPDPAKLKFPNQKKIKGTRGFASNGTWTYCCRGHERVAKEVSRN